MREFVVGVYWPPRKETAEQCALRLQQFLQRLYNCDVRFTRWFNNDRPRRRLTRNVLDPQNLDDLTAVVVQGKYIDDDGKPMDDLGFQISLANWEKGGDLSTLNINCSSCSVGNSLILDLPSELGMLRDREAMASVLSAALDAWEPESGGVMSIAALEAKEFKIKVPFVNWMFYQRDLSPAQIRSLTQCAEVRRVEPRGFIIVTKNEPIDPTNQEDWNQVARVELALKAEG